MPDPTPVPGTIGDKNRKKKPAATPTEKPFNYDTGKDPAKRSSGDLISSGLEKFKKAGKKALPFV